MISHGLRLCWILWWAVWAAYALPWAELDSRAHWDRVTWVPWHFVRPRDVFHNFVFFIPFGVLARCSDWRVRRVLALAAATALTAEVVQVFALLRWPSMSDLVANVAGAAAGLVLTRGTTRRPRVS